MKAISVEKTVKEILSRLFLNGTLKSKNDSSEPMVEFIGFVDEIIIPKDVDFVMSCDTDLVFYNHKNNALFHYYFDYRGNKILSAHLVKKGAELLLIHKREFILQKLKNKLLMQWRSKTSFSID